MPTYPMPAMRSSTIVGECLDVCQQSRRDWLLDIRTRLITALRAAPDYTLRTPDAAATVGCSVQAVSIAAANFPSYIVGTLSREGRTSIVSLHPHLRPEAPCTATAVADRAHLSRPNSTPTIASPSSSTTPPAA